MAKYPKLRIQKRSIVFKVKVKDSAKVGEAIVNKAIAKDPKMSLLNQRLLLHRKVKR